MESGFAAFFTTEGGWKNLVMIIIAFVLLYLGIVKKFEPLLLCGIAFGCLLTNLSYFVGLGENALYHPELWEAFLDEASPYYHSYGHAQQLFVDDSGELMYRVNNPSGGVDIIPDGDVMGVVDAFVAEHPDFSYQGHKGTIALTGFQGAFGYDYDIPEQADQLRVVAAALKEHGWNFASHSYTHNRVNNFYGPGCSVEKISYDINKWVEHVVPCIGETRLFIAPFGYRVQQPALQCILDAGFEIYCTVDSKVYNELNDDYALMSRIEIGGYSMTYYRDILNERFFDVDSVFDAAGRPPVIG